MPARLTSERFLLPSLANETNPNRPKRRSTKTDEVREQRKLQKNNRAMAEGFWAKKTIGGLQSSILTTFLTI
tara:strand:+ start:207 stop:422 length:216 start_codon:yes stop_codon:yes gene_type:complete